MKNLRFKFVVATSPLFVATHIPRANYMIKHKEKYTEQQRIALAKIMVKSPQLILADEPTGSLDARNRDIVLAMLRQLNEEGKTIVVVTHDPTVSACAKRHINLG